MIHSKCPPFSRYNNAILIFEKLGTDVAERSQSMIVKWDKYWIIMTLGYQQPVVFTLHFFQDCRRDEPMQILIIVT